MVYHLEKAKISKFQLYVLIVHYILGAASVISIGEKAKQSAWISVLIASIIGILIFVLIYGSIFKFNKELTFVKTIEKHFGKILGKIIAFLFILYFIFISLFVIRHIYEVISLLLLPETPKIVINSVSVLLTIYSVSKGIETVARTGEIYFFGTILAYIAFTIFLLFSDVVNIDNLFPMFEVGFLKIIKAAIPLFLIFPFGELVVFLSLLHYTEREKGTIKACVLAIMSGGFILILLNFLNITTIGPYLIENTPFPTLKTIRLIKVQDFIQRLDSLAVLIFLTSTFFKLKIFYFAIASGLRDIFGTKKYTGFLFPAAITAAIASILFTDNYTYFIYFIKNYLPLVTLNFELVIPIILLIIILYKKYIKKSQ